MDIYKKLPLDICLNVINNFRMDYFNQLKFEIKNSRRKFVFQKILKHTQELLVVLFEFLESSQETKV